MVKNLPAMQEMQGQSLNWKNPQEEGMATHSSILKSGKSHGQRSLEGYSAWGHKELTMIDQLNNNKSQNHSFGKAADISISIFLIL